MNIIDFFKIIRFEDWDKIPLVISYALRELSKKRPL